MATHHKKPKKTTAHKSSGKERITITIDKELLEWIDEKINKKIFANRSHAVEYITARMQEQ